MNSASPNLDLLRSLAVTFVVASHLLLDRSVVSPGGYDTHTLGTLGVMIFFVHTCMVLMFSLQRQAGIYRSNFAVSFMVARAFRIFPLSIVVVALLSLLERMVTGTGPSLSTFLSNILLIQNITGAASITPVLWSLPFEFQMYFFLPALYLLSQYSGEHSSRYILVLWCTFVGLVFVFWLLGVDFSLIKFFPCFLPGVLAFCQRRRARSLPPAALLAYVAGVALLYPLIVGHGFSATVFSWLICLMLGMTIPRCAEIKSQLVRTGSNIIARYSYGIYLVHDPIRYFCFHYLKGLSVFESWSLYICAVLGLSYLAYHWIEKPGIALGRVLVDRLNAARAQARQDP